MNVDNMISLLKDRKDRIVTHEKVTSQTLIDFCFLPAALFLCESLLDVAFFGVNVDFGCFTGVSFDVCRYEDRTYVSNLNVSLDDVFSLP